MRIEKSWRNRGINKRRKEETEAKKERKMKERKMRTIERVGKQRDKNTCLYNTFSPHSRMRGRGREKRKGEKEKKRKKREEEVMH